jgi:hypothetical protein
MASGSNAPFSGEFVDLENVPKLPEGISAEQIFEQNSDVIRQVAEARHQAGLSQVNADGGFFDAFADATKIVSDNNVFKSVGTEGLIRLDQPVENDGFEDGSSDLGFDSVSGISVVSGGRLNGSNTLRLDSNDEFLDATRSLKQPVPKQTKFLLFRVQGENAGGLNNAHKVSVRGDGGFQFVIEFSHSNSEITINGDKIRSWSDGVNYKVEIKPDYNNQEFEIFVNGTSEGTFPYSTTGQSEIDEIQIRADTASDNNSFSCFFDDVLSGIGSFFSNGSVQSKQFKFSDPQGNTFSPSKVGIFPNQTLNNQSISYDLKDSSGTVVKTFNQSDLNQLQSVNTTDTTFQVEANLSGNGSQTPELEFLDVRGV